MSEHPSYSVKDYLLFLIPSLFGLVSFLIPLPFSSGYDLFVGMLARKILGHLEIYLPTVLLLLLGSAAIFSSLSHFKKNTNFFISYFKVNSFWLIIRILGFLFCLSCYFKIGPSFIYHENTGSMLFRELLPFLFCIFICAGFLLPLLLNFGLLEFFGVLLTKIMRPVFTLPGRSSLDCIASVIGDGSIGILLTNKQYEEGFYSRREAMVIATTFSFVSLTFCFVVLAQAKLTALAIPFFITISVAAFVAAVICPRIPPLSRVEDTYFKKRENPDSEPVSKTPLLIKAFRSGLALAKKNSSLKAYIKEGATSVLDMWFGVLPAVMAFGTVSLVIATYTPLFKYLGLIVYPLLYVLRVPEAYEASQAVVIGFSDMFLPVIISHGIKSDFTRFVIACTSVSQLIFMSEVGALLLSSKIGIKFLDLVLIFIIRTVITLPIIVICAHLLL